MSNNVYQVLVRTRGLIANPRNWSKGAFAFTEQCRTDWSDPLACRWCLTGAVLRAAWTIGDPSLEDIIHRTLRLLETVIARRVDVSECPNPSINCSVWNDAPTTTHADVLQVIDEGITMLGQT